ncbi:Glyoxalase-like domain-containing protein [Ruegeria halocynthiae]|uniref:Glyoxalase-like domain-containing protein n=1 Tax=Ruegeria halocynthiae TaxID=985054 RepID=A0A1H2V9M4_9RHOB|nr:VOC family protein [Ruegeria halocynthiae]SDW65041.1 Glyoxalase-like domain-containing protein [Ruegeria halocynthiae]
MLLDHLAVAGETLDEASAHIEQALGVHLQDGGKHEKFGTYNRLLGLHDGLYLEAIAIDPQAQVPERTRWFDLDRFQGSARLSNWICRVSDIEASLSVFPDGVGTPIDLSRGALRWRMAVPPSGRLPFDNLFPALIQWQGDLHPAQMLQNNGCRLRRLIVCHPDALDLAKGLGALEQVVFDTGPAALRAEFDTPHGPRVLE